MKPKVSKSKISVLFLSLASMLLITFGIKSICLADLNDGLVAYYPFNGNANDESINDNNGTVYGATLVADRFGNANSAYSFDGVDDYIEVNNDPSINPTEAISLVAWYRYSPFNGYGNNSIINKGYTSHTYPHYQYHLGITDDTYISISSGSDDQGKINFSISSNSNAYGITTEKNTLSNEVWCNIVSIYDGTFLKIYVDGVLLNSDSITGSMVDYGKNLVIGSFSNRDTMTPYGGKSLYTKGIIDDIHIYNRALSENEIQELYHGPIILTIPENATEGDGVIVGQGKISVDYDPNSDLVVSLSSNDTSEITVPDTVTIFADQNSATFDITIEDDFIMDGNQSVTITASASGYTSGFDTIQINDNDIAGITVDPISGLITGEDGTTDTFTVVLDSEPTDDVTIALSNNDSTEGTITTLTPLIFTSVDWNIPQTVTIVGEDDDIVDSDQNYTIILASVTSNDPIYDGLDPNDVTVTNIDDEASIIISENTAKTTEAGGNETFTVKLNTQPTDDVTITFSSSDDTEGSVTPTSLTFTSADWNIPQTITITGKNDDEDDGDINYTIIVSEAVSSDGEYNGLNPSDISAINIDDDGPKDDDSSGLCFIKLLQVK